MLKNLNSNLIQQHKPLNQILYVIKAVSFFIFKLIKIFLKIKNNLFKSMRLMIICLWK